MELTTVNVKLVGITPLLMNRPDPEVIAGKVDLKQMSPEEQAAYAIYGDKDGNPVWPIQNIIACLYAAAKGVKMPGKGRMGLGNFIPLIHFTQPEIPITNGKAKAPAEPKIHSALVVMPSGGSIMRHRPVLENWSISFPVKIAWEYFGVSEEKVLAIVRELFEVAGIRIGFGDWRPARKGIYGTFALAEFKKAKKQSA